MTANLRAFGFVAAAFLTGLAAAAPCVHAGTYIIDKDHTEVRFTWDHLGLSRQGGRFRDVSGTLSFDPKAPEASVLDVTIPLKSISTGVAKLDEHLVSSKEFFDVAQWPAITFKSTSVRMTDAKIAEVTGNLTLNGVTKPVTLDVVWNFTGEHPLAAINPIYKDFYSSGFSATTQIFRSDFGITRTIPYVSDEIRITIETEMHRAPGASAGPAASVAIPAAPALGHAPLAPAPSVGAPDSPATSASSEPLPPLPSATPLPDPQ